MARDERRRSVRDKVRQDAKDVGYGSGGGYIRLPPGMEFYEIKAGTNEIDVLAYEVKSTRYAKADPGELFYRREYKVHHQIGSEKKSYICPMTFGRKCPICEYRDELAQDYKANEKLISALKPQVKDIYFVDGDGRGKKIKVLDFSHHNFTKKLAEEVRESENQDVDAFADLEKGYTLKARFSEESFAGKKYLECTRVDFVERGDYPESLLDTLPDLDELLVEVPYNTLQKIFLELDDEPEQRKERRPASRQHDLEEDVPLSEEEPAPTRGRQQSDPESEPETKATGRRGRGADPEPEPPAREHSRGRRSAEPKPEPDPEPRRERGRGKTDNPCPEGFEYGVDADKHDACQNCTSWEACMDRRDELEAENKAGRRK